MPHPKPPSRRSRLDFSSTSSRRWMPGNSPKRSTMRWNFPRSSARNSEESDGPAQPVPQAARPRRRQEVRRHDWRAEMDLRNQSHHLRRHLRLRISQRPKRITDKEPPMAKGQLRSNREKKKPKQPPKPTSPTRVPGLPQQQPWKK